MYLCQSALFKLELYCSACSSECLLNGSSSRRAAKNYFHQIVSCLSQLIDLMTKIEANEQCKQSKEQSTGIKIEPFEFHVGIKSPGKQLRDPFTGGVVGIEVTHRWGFGSCPTLSGTYLNVIIT